jgi:hypothetical protein
MENRFNYFYGKENEQYLFLQMPLMLIKDEKFKGLSDSAKILYSLLLNRTSLSAKNGWLDKEGRVYIIYTIKEMEQDLNCGEQKAIKTMSELKAIGLANTIRRGLTKPNIIYVMNFATDLKYPTKEKKEEKKEPESRTEPLNNDFHGSETMIFTEQNQLKSRPSNINPSKNHFTNTEVSIDPAQPETETQADEPAVPETIDKIGNEQPKKTEATKETVADKIRLSELISEQPDKKDKISEVYDIICDVLIENKTDTIRVAKMQFPAVAVKRTFSSLEKAHIVYVLDCLEKNSGNIRNNSKGYILTSLYNSLHSIGFYKPRSQSAFNDTSKPKANGFDADAFITQQVRKNLRF